MNGMLIATTGVQPNIEHVPPQPGGAPRRSADIGRARVRLGFDPPFEVAEGLKRFDAWYLTQDAGS
jgi:nucleoside-diphosphate-sugar epimerase